jgi:hypothetical protein
MVQRAPYYNKTSGHGAYNSAWTGILKSISTFVRPKMIEDLKSYQELKAEEDKEREDLERKLYEEEYIWEWYERSGLKYKGA